MGGDRDPPGSSRHRAAFGSAPGARRSPRSLRRKRHASRPPARWCPAARRCRARRPRGCGGPSGAVRPRRCRRLATGRTPGRDRGALAPSRSSRGAHVPSRGAPRASRPRAGAWPRAHLEPNGGAPREAARRPASRDARRARGWSRSPRSRRWRWRSSDRCPSLRPSASGSPQSGRRRSRWPTGWARRRATWAGASRAR